MPTGWPYDNIHKAYTALQPITAAELIEFQNQIRTLFQLRHTVFTDAHPESSAWTRDTTNFHLGWKKEVAGDKLFVPCTPGLISNTVGTVKKGAIIKEVKIKVLNSGTASIVAELWKADSAFSVSADGVTESQQGSTVTAAVNSDEEVLTITPTEFTLGEDEHLYVSIGSATSTDRVYGVRVSYWPLTHYSVT